MLSVFSSELKQRKYCLLEMDDSTKPPQISEMWQKFALAFKTKTIEFFADDEDAATTAGATDTEDGFGLLDSAEEFITDQKVVVLKPDKALINNSSSSSRPSTPVKFSNSQFVEPLLSSIFATISSFEASYLQLQAAHVPLDEEAIVSADKTLVSHLQRLYEFREWYKNYRRNPNSCLDLPIGSCLEVQVQENQSKLRRLETIVNQLQSAIDDKDDKVSSLRQQLSDIHNTNARLSKNHPSSLGLNSSGILLTIRVFDSMLREASRSLHKFAMFLIDLMKKAGWDMDLTANSVFSGVNYAKKGHNRYSILSYVSLTMFRGFDSESFGLELGGDEEEHTEKKKKNNNNNNNSLNQLIEHVASSPMEILRKDPNCKFSRFCETKYQNLVHPAMETSIFSNLEQNEMVLSSWLSISGFYESFIKMSSSLWLLHKLAYSFNPGVEIFQVDRDADFSMVYMEDVTRKIRSFVKNRRAKVAFTVIPGFKIGNTIIQSQVYLST